MSDLPLSSPLEETVAIVGVGLIGGSLAAALRQRGVARHLIGVGRDTVRIEQAKFIGLVDEVATDVVEIATKADVIVFCTPVDRITSGVIAVSSHVRPGTLLTDAGSVKQSICNALTGVTSFVGSHPIAGSHRQGFEAADAQLFEGRLCVVTPQPATSPSQLARLERFWQAVGMRTVTMSADAHDEALAMTSHLPHLVAAALAATMTFENEAFAGTGFRDTTRIAAGDPDLWSGILASNASAVIDGIDNLQKWLAAYREALVESDAARIRELLQAGQMRRRRLDDGATRSGKAS